MSFLLVLYLAPPLVKYFQDVPVLPDNTFKLLGLFGLILVLELIVGIILSLTGSILAVSRTRKRK